MNLVERFRAEGRQLADWQVQALRELEGSWLPGTQYVTVIVQFDGLRPTSDGGLVMKWVAAGWVYTFEVDGELVLGQLKQKPQCPPGTEGTPPDCRPPCPDCGPPPCPPGTVGFPPDCRPEPPDCVNPDERWNPDTQRCERVQTGRPGRGLRFFLNE